MIEGIVTRGRSSLFFGIVVVGIILAAFFITCTMPAISVGGLNDINSPFVDDAPGNKNQANDKPENASCTIGENGSYINNVTKETPPKCSGSDTSGPSLSAQGCQDCSSEPIFEIYGKPYANFTRVLVGERYDNGYWTPDLTSVISYDGGYMPQELTKYSNKIQSNISINPIAPFSGYIPTIRYSNKITLLAELPIKYYLNLNVFYVQGQFDKGYIAEFSYYQFNPDLLQSTTLDRSSAVYLEIPSNLKNCLDFILGQVDFSHAYTEYDRITAIRDYLVTNYVYDKKYTPAPEGHDPVEWFLLTEKRGVCANFNSAFVLLLRENGIPARYVTGYAINPDDEYQIVTSCKAHGWAEVRYADLGWVEFDATGRSDGADQTNPTALRDTQTEITNLSPSAVKGGSFLTEGKVTDLTGNPVSGLKVTILLKVNKNDAFAYPLATGITANDGHFQINAYIPKTVTVGNYQIVAKTQANNIYKGSESDPTLQVNAETALSLLPTGSASVGQPFAISSQLNESETKTPLSNQQLILTYTINGEQKQLLTYTNDTGIATFSLGIIPSIFEDYLNFTVKFDQTGFYLPSEINGSVEIQLPVSNFTDTPQTGEQNSIFLGSPLILGILSSVIGILITTIGFFLYKKKKKPSIKQAPIEPNQSPLVFVGGKSGDNVTLKVDFPCISPPFPDVWGVGESFKVQLHLTKNNHPFEGTLEVQFGDQKPMMLITDVNGIAEIELKTNIKGNYLVSAKYNPQSHNDLVAKRSLRIVDYVEEIVSIFKDTFEVQKAKGVQINQETTPREFQCALQQSFNLPDKEPLNEFVTIFEIADYSLYKLHRVDYEKMFLAALSVKEAPKKEARFD